jgi:hypothetical protein
VKPSSGSRSGLKNQLELLGSSRCNSFSRRRRWAWLYGMVWHGTRVIISMKINYIIPLFQMMVGAGRDGSIGILFMGITPAGLLAGRCFRSCRAHEEIVRFGKVQWWAWPHAWRTNSPLRRVMFKSPRAAAEVRKRDGLFSAVRLRAS